MRVVKEDVEGVVGRNVVSLCANVGGDGLRCAEQGHGLIKQVRREVEKNAAARTGLFAPGTGLGSRAEAIIGGFEANDAAECASSDGLAEGLEVGVKAAIVIDREDKIFLVGEIQDGEGFSHGGGERLVDDDMAAGFEESQSEGEMGLVGSGNRNEADGIDGKEFVEGTHDAHVRVELRRRTAGALENSGKAKTGDGVNHGSMEAAAAEAKTDEADV